MQVGAALAGEWVLLAGLERKAEYNGTLGRVHSFNDATSRYNVQLHGRCWPKHVSLLHKNLAPLPPGYKMPMKWLRTSDCASPRGCNCSEFPLCTFCPRSFAQNMSDVAANADIHKALLAKAPSQPVPLYQTQLGSGRQCRLFKRLPGLAADCCCFK